MPKDKLGGFSKLLEGLLRNFKAEPRGTEPVMENGGDTPEPGEFSQGTGKTTSIKKAVPQGVKNTLFFRGGERIQNKEVPAPEAEETRSGEEGAKIPAGSGEEGQGAAAEEAVSLFFLKNRAGESPLQTTTPDGSPELLPEELGAEETALSGDTGRWDLQNQAGPAGVQKENVSPGRKTGEGEASRDIGILSRRVTPETEPETVRLVRVPDKAAGNTETVGRANPRRNEPVSRDKRRERAELEVRDLRTAAPEAAVNRGPSGTPEPPGAVREVELRSELPGNSRNAGEGLSAGGSTPARAFEEVLAGELRGGLGDDIVRQASIILKDGGAGLIRLTLKPESLGSVKIRLEMAENKIAGRIIVESNEALRAFEREIQSLEQAFKDSGFNGASIEMSVSSDNGGSRGNRQGKGEEASPFFSERLHLAASGYESAGELPVLIGNSGVSSAIRPVNMLV
jgi:hypothetical protein